MTMTSPQRSGWSPGGLHRLSPSLALLRQMSGISADSHDEVMIIASRRMSDRSSLSPPPRRIRGNNDDVGLPSREGHTTYVATSRNGTPVDRSLLLGTPESRTVHYSRMSPLGATPPCEAGVDSHNARNSTRTPNARNFGSSLLRSFNTSCSSLRFNPASLVSLPYMFCNNTFMKIKADDVFDPRLGKRRRVDHGDATSGAATAQGKRQQRQQTGVKQAEDKRENMVEATRLFLHNEYALNPYSKRYANRKDRRTVEKEETSRKRSNKGGSSDALTTESREPTELTVDEQVTSEKVSEAFFVKTPERNKEIHNRAVQKSQINGLLPLLRQLSPLAEKDRGAIEQLNQKRQEIEKELIQETIDIVDISYQFKRMMKNLKGGRTTEDRQPEVIKLLDILSEMAKVVKKLLSETEESITVLQYSKMLLNGVAGERDPEKGDRNSVTFSEGGNEDGPASARSAVQERDNVDLRPFGANMNNDHAVATTTDFVASSPCVAFMAGLTCVKGLCSTSFESFSSPKAVECSAAAGCYLWDPKLVSQGQRGGDKDSDGIIVGPKMVNSGNYITCYDGANYDQEDMELDRDVVEVQVNSKKGPWTCDAAFSRKIVQNNLKRRFDSMRGFLEDISKVAVAEIVVPKPECRGSSEQNCASENCCSRCCTCKDGLTILESLKKPERATICDDTKFNKLHIEKELSKINMKKNQMGKCVCQCKCFNGNQTIDQIVREHSKPRTVIEEGIIWHDMQPMEVPLDPQNPILINESVYQERITLRVKSSVLPKKWRQRAPFLCKLDLSFTAECETEDGVKGAITKDNGDTSRQEFCPSSIDIINYSNLEEGYLTDGSDMDVDEGDYLPVPPYVKQSDKLESRRSLLFKFPDFKPINEFSIWDALEILSAEQEELHSLQLDDLDYFDPLEVDTGQLRQEKLQLSLDSLASGHCNNDDHVDIAFYLPYVPSCILPWRFESISSMELIEQRKYLCPEVETRYIYNAVSSGEIITAGEGSAKNTDEEFLNGVTMLDTNGATESTTAVEQRMSSIEWTPSRDEFDSATQAGVAQVGSPEPMNWSQNQETEIDSYPSLAMVSVLRRVLFRGFSILPDGPRYVQEFMREHILMRNQILKKEAEACSVYRYAWHNHLNNIKKSSPTVDLFAWGILPVRAIDLPHMFIPLPAGYKQNDINWPYRKNGVLSPFEVEGYGIWDLENKRQRFSILGQASLDEADLDRQANELVYTARKPMVQRRRNAVDGDTQESQEEETIRAPVWLAPSYSNLTGPGIRWNYTCMDTLSEPLQCVPDFGVIPINKVISSPDFGLYSIDHHVQYDRNNRLSNEQILQDSLLSSVSSMWTRHECRVFIEKYLMYPKNFAKIAQFIETKRCSDCVDFYYRFKYRLKLKERLVDLKEKPKSKYEMSRFSKRDMHVMQALDSLFDNCYTEKIQEFCEQNSLIMGSINEYLLHPGGTDTGKNYEIALTQHRGNWSPLDEDLQVTLDNLNEGYFMPTSFRCLVTRKNISLPLSLALEKQQTTVKRGCLVLNGKRDYNDLQQLRSIISAIKMDHFLSLKPLYSRRVTGRSILEALHASLVEQTGYVEETKTEETKKSNKVEAPGTKAGATADGNMLPSGRKESPEPKGAKTDRRNEVPGASRSKDPAKIRNKVPVDTSRDYAAQEAKLQAALVQPKKSRPRTSRKSGYEMPQPPESDHEEQAGSQDHFVSPGVSRSGRVRRPSYKVDGLGNNMGTVQPTATMEYNAQQVQPYEKEDPQKRRRLSTIWTAEEIQEMFALYSIYGPQWEIIEVLMAPHGKKRNEILDFYDQHIKKHRRLVPEDILFERDHDISRIIGPGNLSEALEAIKDIPILPLTEIPGYNEEESLEPPKSAKRVAFHPDVVDINADRGYTQVRKYMTKGTHG